MDQPISAAASSGTRSQDRAAPDAFVLQRHTDKCDCVPGKPARAADARFSTGWWEVVIFLVKLLAIDRLVGHLGKFDDEIDHLLLEDRRPHGRERIGVLAVEVPDFLLATGELAHPLDQRPVELVL